MARAVLAHHRGAVGEHPLLQWVDVDALWMHQPWRVDDVMRGVVEANLRAVLGGAAVAGVDVVIVTWTFHDRQLRDVVVGAAPDDVEVRSVQLVASEAVWRQRFEADEHRPRVDAFYEQRYAQAQSAAADLLLDTSVLDVEHVAAQVAEVTHRRDGVEVGRARCSSPSGCSADCRQPTEWSGGDDCAHGCGALPGRAVLE